MTARCEFPAFSREQKSVFWRDIPSVNALFTVPVAIDTTIVQTIDCRPHLITNGAITPAITGCSIPITVKAAIVIAAQF